MPATPAATFDRLCALLMKDYKLDAGQLTPDAPLDALGIDSLGVADLLFNIEDEFGISLGAEPVQLLTVGDVARFIDEQVAAQQHPAGTAGNTQAGGPPGPASSAVT